MTSTELHACRCRAVNFARCKRHATPAPSVTLVRQISSGTPTRPANSRQLPHRAAMSFRADRRAGRRDRRGSIPAWSAGRGTRGGDHRRRQHRRRRDDARAADLSRPRHRHLHPRRRHRRGARLGPGRRELDGQGGAGRLRRRPRLVRPRRPRPRHPPDPHPDARRRLPALGGHRRARRPLAARRHRAADERPAGRDPRRRRPTRRPAGTQAIHFQEWWVRHRAALERLGVRPGRASTTPARPRASSRRSPPPTPSCSRRPTRSSRSARSSACPACARRCCATPAGSSASPRSSAARSLRGMADRCLPVLGIEVSAEGVGRHYGARSAGGLLDAWLVHTGDAADVPGVDVRHGAAADVLARGDHGAGPRRAGRRRCLSRRRASRSTRSRGCRSSRPGDDLAGAIAGAAPWLADGDVVVVTSKVVSKVEGRLVHVAAGRRPGGGPPAGDRRTRPCAWWPAAARWRIVRDPAGLGGRRGRHRRVERRPGRARAAARGRRRLGPRACARRLRRAARRRRRPWWSATPSAGPGGRG